mgnify:CR=1 FL=1
MLKTNFYIYNSADGFILVNFETKESFLLDENSFKALVSKNADQNEDFKAAGIIGSGKVETIPYDIAAQIFHSQAHIKEFEMDKDYDFWRFYLNLSDNNVKDFKKLNHDFGKEFQDTVFLPKAEQITGDFYSLLKKRRTIREFVSKAISVQELSNLLYITFGEFHENFGEKYVDNNLDIAWRRSSPSSGGLNVIDPYVYVFRIHGLEEGIYYYDSKNHLLRLVKKINDFQECEKEMKQYIFNQHFYMGCSALIFSVANYKKLKIKYPHDRAYVFPFLDNGHLFQTAMLTITAMNLQYWLSSAFCTEYFMKEMKLKNYQLPLCLLAVGHGYNLSLGPKNIKEIDKIASEVESLKTFATEEETVSLK